MSRIQAYRRALKTPEEDYEGHHRRL